MAREGLRFTNGYANSSVCSPTRFALMTGRYQYRLRGGNDEPIATRSRGNPDLGLPPGEPTLPSVLRGAGYTTALVGKWHLGFPPHFGPLQSGYHEFFGVMAGGVDYFTHRDGPGVHDLCEGETQAHRTGYLTDLISERALEYIERRKGAKAPFLLSVHYTAPHWPWETRDDAAESARIGNSIVHTDGGSVETYLAMIRHMDEGIGRIIQALKGIGADENTMVVFTSDNGGERFSDTWPFTGKKTELLEGGLRVPAIVRWPGVTAAGSTSDVPIMSMDWMPTFLAAGGGAPDPAYPLDGTDIMPALKGETMEDRMLFWRFTNKGQQAVRHGEWKYLKIAGNSFLFNVIDDPLERANWKDRNPEKFAELEGAFGQWNSTMLYDPDAPSYGFTPEMLADHFGIDS